MSLFAVVLGKTLACQLGTRGTIATSEIFVWGFVGIFRSFEGRLALVRG